ncbi:hypothetical protein M407DRAFT_26713 [Tulasnella calospora MUT 4182]|uniref:Cep57 centrosome microtubule-binding domain-containing protein n=1 Tax=Tulasnella calospora MUT 4182 TaxID=1051891 RepID=A0A0C3QDV3_9AGAM|nr:hypothetical protein M407DRAFT_26713 [Tulasnella calospora MUT 4182]
MYRRGHLSYDDEESQYRIGADRQEEDRLGLEALIRRGIDDISLAPLSTDNEQDYSVEYPRHGHHSPLPFDPYSSFARSQNEFDFVPEEDVSGVRPPTFQSRRSKPAAAFASFGPEDESYGIGGETVSTTGHHRSAVTFNAGLGGLADSPREGNEYDPDRRLDRLLDNRPHMSMFDDGTPRNRRAHPGHANRSRQSNKSRETHVQSFASHPTFDPVIVDDTNEIDRAVEAGHLQFNNIPPIPQSNSRIPRNHPRDDDTISHPESDGTSFRRSEPPSPPARPKLSDALERVADDNQRYGPFSPRRQAFSPTHSPRTRNAVPSTSRASPPPAEQSSSNLNRGKSAKGITRDPNSSRSQAPAWDEANQRARRHPLLEAGNRTADLSAARLRRAATLPIPPTPMGKVQLPDVTGITNAVETPLKDRLGYLAADPQHRPNSKQFNAAVEELAARLREVERENATSRRRVKELERELEECKEEVHRERTRLYEELEKSRVQSPDASDRKGKRREVALNPEEANGAEFWKARYDEVVEQKEALETLVSTLRAHIARMTKELEERQHDLQELRQIRERDALALQSKLHEVEEAHEQVDELAAEVDRLRAIIDEGLRERRRAKEAEEMLSRASLHPGELSTVREATNEDEDESQAEDMYGHYQYQSQPNRQYSPPGQDQSQEDAQTEHDYAGGREQREEQPRHTVRIALHEPTLEYTVGDVTQPLEPEPVQPHQQLFGRQRSGSNATTVRSASRLSSRAPSPRFGGQVRVAPEPVRRAPSRMSNLRGDGGRSPDLGDDAATTSSLGRPVPPGSRRFITAAELQRLEADVEDRRSERSMSTNHTGDGDSQPFDPNLSRAGSDPGSIAPGRPTKYQHNGRPGSRLTRHHSSPPTHTGGAPVPHLRSKQAEKLFFEQTNHDESTCTKCHRRRKDRSEAQHEEWLATFLKRRTSRTAAQDGDMGDVDVDRLPPQTVLARVVRELEDEFTHHKSIYVELAEQYALMDAASNVAKRNVLAEHLREVIDILEQKGDQIASLYDLLAFKDKPVPPKVGRSSPPTTAPVV